jgi:hypothetical protein
MGFIYFAAWGGTFLVLGSMAGAVAIILGAKAGGRAWFFPVAIVVALVALTARLWVLMEPHVAAGGVPVWPTMYALIFQVPLLASVPLAAVAFWGLRIPPSVARQVVTGVGAGIAGSVVLQLLTPFVLGRLVALLGLRTIY